MCWALFCPYSSGRLTISVFQFEMGSSDFIAEVDWHINRAQEKQTVIYIYIAGMVIYFQSKVDSLIKNKPPVSTNTEQKYWWDKHLAIIDQHHHYWLLPSAQDRNIKVWGLGGNTANGACWFWINANHALHTLQIQCYCRQKNYLMLYTVM